MIKTENYGQITENSLENAKNLAPSFVRRMRGVRLRRTGGSFANFFDDRGGGLG